MDEIDGALMRRAYSVLNVKELKEDERVIRGDSHDSVSR
jgi:hypothetical protein